MTEKPPDKVTVGSMAWDGVVPAAGEA